MAPAQQTFPLAGSNLSGRNGVARPVELAPMPAAAPPAPVEASPVSETTPAPTPTTRSSTARPVGKTTAAGRKGGTSRKPKASPSAGAKRAPVKRSPSTPAELPVWVRRTTMVAVVAVAVVAAIVSYEHMRVLAGRSGEGWRAWLLPISVDGLTVAASMTMLVRRQAGQAPDRLARVSLALGLGASLAANVVAADPTLVDPGVVHWVVAAWPPVALGLGYELLMKQMHPGGSGFHSRRRPGAPDPLDPARPARSGRRG